MYWLGTDRGMADAQRGSSQNETINQYENADKIGAMREIGKLDPQDLG